MQSQGYGSSFFRNPTLIAMIVSVGLHGVFAILTLLMPAESRTAEKMRLVGIVPVAPQNNTPANDPNNPNGTLPVPGGAPPLGFGDSPFGTTGLERFLQNPSSANSPFGRQPAQTAFAPIPGGASGFKLPPIRDVPNRAPGRPIPTVKSGRFPSRGMGALPTPRQGTGSSAYDQSQFGSGLPPLQQGSPSGSGSFLNPGQSDSSDQQFGREPTFSQAARNLRDWYGNQQQLTDQPISGMQQGGTLIAAFPAAACGQTNGATIQVAARFGTDGRYAGNLMVLEGSGVPALDTAAIAKVQSHQVAPASILQAFSFDVAVMPSESVCPTPAPATPAPITPSTPGALPSVKPDTSSPQAPTSPTPAAPTPAAPTSNPPASEPSQQPKPDNNLREDAPLPGAASPAAPAPAPAPAPPIAPSSPLPAPPTPSVPAPAPAPAAPPEPTPAPEPEPLPAPEIAPAPEPEPPAPEPAAPAPAASPTSPPPAP
jgi:hypothetical protein